MKAYEGFDIGPDREYLVASGLDPTPDTLLEHHEDDLVPSQAAVHSKSSPALQRAARATVHSRPDTAPEPREQRAHTL